MRQNNTPPDTIRIFGGTWSVALADEIEEDRLGETHHANTIILLGNEQSETAQRDTMLHEVMHAVWYLMDLGENDEIEEQVVRRMATGLLAVLRDNPQLVQYLTA